jgi:hypothetical protein
VMQETIQQSGSQGGITGEDSRPVLESDVGGDDDRAALVAFRDDLKEGALRRACPRAYTLTRRSIKFLGSGVMIPRSCIRLVDLLVCDLKNDRPKLEQQVPIYCSHSSWMPTISRRLNPNTVSRPARACSGRTSSTAAAQPSLMTTSASIPMTLDPGTALCAPDARSDGRTRPYLAGVVIGLRLATATRFGKGGGNSVNA